MKECRKTAMESISYEWKALSMALDIKSAPESHHTLKKSIHY
jgi:hypothetical protein